MASKSPAVRTLTGPRHNRRLSKTCSRLGDGVDGQPVGIRLEDDERVVGRADVPRAMSPMP